MIEKTVIVVNKTGFHVRPASVLVREVIKHKAQTTIIYNGSELNAASVTKILQSGIKCGDEITVRCDGESEAEVLEAISALIQSGLGEK